MPLLVSLTRETEKHDLGAHEAVELGYDELGVSGSGRMLAGHRHNRWMAAGRTEPFSHLEIDGPLIVTGPGERVFAFTDVQQRDWYMHDVGKHWPSMKILFHETGP